jgi:antitoxin component YwqK of YwqJK toxin-antitoxin module
MKQDKTPFNKQSQPHGYWESYHSNGKLCYKGNYINGKEDGYWEWYHPNGQLWFKGNYINGKQDGLWIQNRILPKKLFVNFYV